MLNLSTWPISCEDKATSQAVAIAFGELFPFVTNLQSLGLPHLAESYYDAPAVMPYYYLQAADDAWQNMCSLLCKLETLFFSNWPIRYETLEHISQLHLLKYFYQQGGDCCLPTPWYFHFPLPDSCLPMPYWNSHRTISDELANFLLQLESFHLESIENYEELPFFYNKKSLLLAMGVSPVTQPIPVFFNNRDNSDSTDDSAYTDDL